MKIENNKYMIINENFKYKFNKAKILNSLYK